MRPLLFYNNARTILALAASSTDTSFTLASGGGGVFSPAPGAGEYFMATLSVPTSPVTEIVKVTSISGDVVTVERAQEGTTALDWVVGASFANLLTAGSASALEADRFVSATFAPTPSAEGNFSLDLVNPPLTVAAFLICTAVDLDFQIGDIVVPESGLQAWVNSTKVGYSISNAGVFLVPKLSDVPAAINAAKWNAYLVASS